MNPKQLKAIRDFVDNTHSRLDQIDYYQLLRVSSASTETEIRQAYYKFASNLHPDIHSSVNDSAFQQRLTSVFSRVVEAYKALSSATTRKRYDRGLSNGDLRLRQGKEIKKSEVVIQDLGAKKFYNLGVQAMNSKNYTSAAVSYTHLTLPTIYSV